MTCTKRGKEKEHTMAMDINMALLSDRLLLLATATEMAPVEGYCNSWQLEVNKEIDSSCKKQ